MKRYLNTFDFWRVLAFVMFITLFSLVFFLTFQYWGILYSIILVFIVDMTAGIGRESPIWKH